jgi:hypothetical protein
MLIYRMAGACEVRDENMGGMIRMTDDRIVGWLDVNLQHGRSM